MCSSDYGGSPLLVIGVAIMIFIASFGALSTISKTFVPAQETGEFQVSLDMPAGTSLEAMDKITREIDQKIRSHPEVRLTLQTTGGVNSEPNQATLSIVLTKSKERSLSTTQTKDVIRKDLESYKIASPKVQDMQAVGGAQSSMVNIVGRNSTS